MKYLDKNLFLFISAFFSGIDFFYYGSKLMIFCFSKCCCKELVYSDYETYSILDPVEEIEEKVHNIVKELEEMLGESLAGHFV